MKFLLLEKMSSEELLALFVKSAQENESEILKGNPKKANRQHSIILAVFKELTRRGERERILEFFDNFPPCVRQWAAAQALEFATEMAEKALERLKNECAGIPSLNAAIILKAWRDGNLNVFQ